MCGTRNPWSFGLEFAREDDGGVHASVAALPHLQGYEGIVHGGVIAALLDSAMTHCLFHRGVRALTADLHVRYLAPVAVHSALEIRAAVVSIHRRLYVLRAEITVDGSTLAWGEAKFREWRGTQR
jgi:uncharacterized protein (TIGR00369 family)